MKARVRFSKLGKIRWTSHRDLARMWERAFRRVELPLAYTQGFSPRPKVSFGLALPTGYESVAEYLDIELDATRVVELDVSTLSTQLSAALPAGVDVMAAAIIDDRATSLQEEVTSTEWDVWVAASPVRPLRELVEEALAADSLVVTRERKGKQVEEDVRPGILSLTVESDEHLRAELGTQPRALRPAELLAAIDASLVEARVRRLSQWISRSDGARDEPLAVPPDALADAPPTTATLERV
ncbi:MAG TPA: TIGR03936 family radical SAM-associated protein [Acidimicrobiales bacterium]|jgi:radical SAM-linked protein|nr:TIGR03936 family radical SAM-associated protein [Acidimicrobiales bacterium]